MRSAILRWDRPDRRLFPMQPIGADGITNDRVIEVVGIPRRGIPHLESPALCIVKHGAAKRGDVPPFPRLIRRDERVLWMLLRGVRGKGNSR